MSKRRFVSLIAYLIMCIPVFVLAATDHGVSTSASCYKPTEKEATELIKKTGGTVTSVKQSPVKGLIELQVEKNGQKGIIYMDCSRKYLMQGMVFDREKLEPVTAHKLDLPQPKQPTFIDVNLIPTKGLVVMGNPNGSKKLYVFTDPDCPYCRRAHEELKKLANIAPDVVINIVLFPLPMHPGAYDKARAVVEIRSQEILDKAFEGKDVPKPEQENSKKIIDENIKFANANGISGTPTVILPDGKVELGVRDGETLKKELEGK